MSVFCVVFIFRRAEKISKVGVWKPCNATQSTPSFQIFGQKLRIASLPSLYLYHWRKHSIARLPD